MSQNIGRNRNDELEFFTMLRHGEPEAIHCLYREFSPRMYSLLVMTWRDKEAVLDAIQDGFIRLIENLDTLKATSMEGIHRWLMVVANNRLKDRAKSGDTKRTTAISQMPESVDGSGDKKDFFETVEHDGPSIEAIIEDLEFSKSVEDMLNAAGSHCAHILKAFSDGWSLADIGRDLSMTVDQVKKRKAKCIRELARIAVERGIYPA